MFLHCRERSFLIRGQDDVLTNHIQTIDQVRLQDKYVSSFHFPLHPRPAAGQALANWSPDQRRAQVHCHRDDHESDIIFPQDLSRRRTSGLCRNANATRARGGATVKRPLARERGEGGGGGRREEEEAWSGSEGAGVGVETNVDVDVDGRGFRGEGLVQQRSSIGRISPGRLYYARSFLEKYININRTTIHAASEAEQTLRSTGFFFSS